MGAVDRGAIDRRAYVFMADDRHDDAPWVLFGHPHTNPLTRNEVGSCGIESAHEVIVADPRADSLTRSFRLGATLTVGERKSLPAI
ncbi:hypothetical protein [Sphaerisporangium perillae]|uniref:hypothetical protein n=1 Tax=Sphaerisporangium perillae TaxID=2935860 RepID=UPI00200F7F0B|nr:hypothetical protein [Sphaerisporangium perillae]